MASDAVHDPARSSNSQQQSGVTSQRRSAHGSEEIFLPLSDQNSWYYPSHGHSSDDEDDLSTGKGNWGNKGTKRARWVRKGKMIARGPGFGDWQADERARKRIKSILSQGRSPSPVGLPHLRDPSPPLVSPYPSPTTQYFSYSSFVMDEAVTRSFRSTQLDEVEQATNSLIEDEATLKRALGRLWQVMSESPDDSPNGASLVPKKEDEDEKEAQDERENRLARVPDLTPAVHKLFLTSYTVCDPSQFTPPELQMDTLTKALAALRELQDDGREFVERLQEIREGLGDVKAQRNSIWDMVRETAIKELHGEALSVVA